MDRPIPTVAWVLVVGVCLSVGMQLNDTQQAVRQSSVHRRVHGPSLHHARPISSSQLHQQPAVDNDLIIWGLKVRGIILHRTFAYYTSPIFLDHKTNLSRNQMFVSPLNGEIWTMAADYYKNKLYYTDHVSNFIGVYDLQTKKTVRTFRGMAWGIDDISVDWVSGNIYWTDSNYNKIMVADRNLTYYRSLLSIESRVPANVAVHPGQRRLYWTEKRNEDCRIYRSNLDGFSKTLLHKFENVRTIIDIVIDYVNERLYWTEILRFRGGVGRVRYISLRENNQENIYPVYSERGSYFFGIASYKENLYVSDDRRKQLLVIDKERNQVIFRHQFNVYEIPRGLAVFSAHEYPISKADETNECSKKSPCQQICLARYGINQFRCECSTGFSIQLDGKSCRSNIIDDNFAILLDTRHSNMFQLNLLYPVEPQQIQVSNVSRPSAAAYDPWSQTIFWADESLMTLSKASIQGGAQSTILSDSQVFSIALDVESGNMYWVDSSKDALFVSNMDGAYRRTLHLEGLHIVWAMTIDTLRGYLYWSDWGQVGVDGSQLGTVKRSRLDGTDVEIIAKPGGNPHGLAFEPEKNILFWTQVKQNAIGWINLENRVLGMYKLPSFWEPDVLRFPFPTGIAYWQDYLYITDRSMKHVLRVSVRDVTKAVNQNGTDAEVRPFGPTMFYELAGIHAYDSSAKRGITVCRNSSCPHLCLPDSDGNPKCVCQDHFKYISSNNSCIQEYATDDTTPPTFGETCPPDIQTLADECSNEAAISFVEPNASDDSGLPVTIKTNIKIDRLPMKVQEGIRVFTYLAIDHSHNVAMCRFRVNVLVRRCEHISLKEIPAEADLGEPSCQEKFGSIVNVTCPGIAGIAYQYKCTESGGWEATAPETCDPQALTDSPFVADSTVTSDEEHTESYSSTAKSTGHRERTVSTLTENDKEKSGATSKNPEHNKMDQKSHQPVAGERPYDVTGLTVGLVVAFLVLVGLGLGGFVIFRRWRKKDFLPGTNWSRTDDRVQLTGANHENGIYLGERDLSSLDDRMG